MLFAFLPILFAAAEIDLSGEWRLSGMNGTGAALECPISVPGGVHHALYKAKLIEDPFYGCNETNVQWVGRRDWMISRTFEVDEAFLRAPSVILRLEDVDTFALILVNGKAVGETSNRFRRWEFDVKPYLKVGRNTIEGHFRSSWHVADVQPQYYEKHFPAYTNGVVYSINYIRKPQCHGGWDWGITQMVTGFCGPVKLVRTDDFRVDYIYSDQAFSADYSKCELRVYADVTAADGVKSTVTNRFVIDKPRLWWPNGMGEQAFHEVTLDVKGRKIKKRIGLRKIEMVNETDVDPISGWSGRSCFFRVNGRAFFAKGANWIPCSAFENDQTPARYRDLLESAKAANMNMIRVWGGGQYEKEIFYDLCDELGLLVWQDFMFACANYPDGPFLENVRAEVRHQIKRLRDHASIALWCGDNECRGCFRAPWEYVKADVPWYFSRFRKRIDLLEGAVAAYDSGRTFWPTSPCNGPDDSGFEYNDIIKGDLHFWGVWHGGEPFSRFTELRPRFCSEFGFQSYPSKETCLTFCRRGDLRLESPVFDHHQKNHGGNKRIRDTMRRYFREPTGFDSLLYLSQVQQALAIKTAIEAWRSLTPWCMGALYWQLNDNWPVSSWSSVEYGGKWKHLHYHAKRFFEPVAVMAVRKTGADKLEIWAVNDGAEAVTRTVTLEEWAFDAASPRAVRTLKDVTLPPGRAVQLDCVSAGADTNSVFLSLSMGTNVNDGFFTEYKYCALAKANVHVSSVTPAGGGAFDVTVETDRPAFYVWLNAAGLRGEFSDNSFTLLPGRSQTLRFTPKDGRPTLQEFRSSLSVTHLEENCRGEIIAPVEDNGNKAALKALGLDI